MTPRKLQTVKNMLAGLSLSGADKMYQQYDDALGLVLAFQRIGDTSKEKFSPNAEDVVTPEFLEAIIQVLDQRGFDFISLAEARRRILKPVGDRRFVVFTFDNAFQETLDLAVPILQKYQIPYTLYAATGLIEGTADLRNMGVEKLVAQQQRLLVQTAKGPLELDCTNTKAKQSSFEFLIRHLTAEVPETEARERLREICWLYKIDLDEMRQNMISSWENLNEAAADKLCTLGSMTIDHHVLSRLDEKQARYEMSQGSVVLEGVTGEKPKHFCFPYGSRRAAGPREFELAQKLKFQTAVTRRPGLIYREHRHHLTALPRISVNGRLQRMRFFTPLTSGLYTRLTNGFRSLNVAE